MNQSLFAASWKQLSRRVQEHWKRLTGNQMLIVITKQREIVSDLFAGRDATVKPFVWRQNMKLIATKVNCVLALLITGILTTSQAFADKPSWAGGGKGDKAEKHERREKSDDSQSKQQQGDKRSHGDNAAHEVRTGEYFDDHRRTVAREYYGEQFRRGRCPPGLAKKHNGCMPPGQAKKWAVGRPLPREVIYYAVPPALVVQFGPPPTGHRYVRVASDILLIAVGTGMVVDAIQDLNRM